MVKDISPADVYEEPRYLTNVGGTLFFTADNGVNGVELWESDGTTDGTVLVKDRKTLKVRLSEPASREAMEEAAQKLRKAGLKTALIKVE